MRLSRKYLSPEELGAMLYEALRSGMESHDDLSMERFVQSLDRGSEELDEQYAGEIMVALMFGGLLSIERSASPRVAEQIAAGMKAEFLNHVQEQGASPLQKAEWEAVIASRFLTYRQSLEGYSGFEPPWKLGRQFFWNLVGVEEYIAMSVKIATLYILAARDACQLLLNEYGPSLIAIPSKF
jgi:hypothetical protein